MPTARARYRRRPVMDVLVRGQIEQYNPADGGNAPSPPENLLLLVDGTSFLLLVDGTSMLTLAA